LFTLFCGRGALVLRRADTCAMLACGGGGAAARRRRHAPAATIPSNLFIIESSHLILRTCVAAAERWLAVAERFARMA
jgi:hypothetical protein